MKKLLVIVLTLFTAFICDAQDYPTGLTEMTPEMRAEYDNIKPANIRVNTNLIKSNGTIAVTRVDNSVNKYFPPVFLQIGGSCAYASGIGYIYNYEYNALNDLDGKNSANNCNYLQVYAMINNGEDCGGFSSQGWKFIKHNGTPSIKDGKTSSITQWASGYNAYYNGMVKGVVNYSSFTSNKYGEIEKMKQYLLDHGNGSKVGGLIQFSAWARPLSPSLYTGINSDKCDAMIHHFGNHGMHSMTIVGFDDKVGYDYDENGIIEGTEMGSFICVNSWGADWGRNKAGCITSNGRFYAPYYTFTKLRQSYKGVPYTKTNMEGGTGNDGKDCLIVRVKKNITKLTAKLVIEHSSRNDLEIEFGVANSKNDKKPFYKTITRFMNHAGGDLNMCGNPSGSNNTLEFGVDISELVHHTNSTCPKYFIKVIDKSIGNSGSGKLINCSIIKYDSKGIPSEFCASINRSELANYKEAVATVSAGVPELEEGINTSVATYINDEQHSIIFYFNSLEETNAKIDLIKDGEIIKSLLNKRLNAGTAVESIDISSLSDISYDLRINVGNRLIYKTIKLK